MLWGYRMGWVRTGAPAGHHFSSPWSRLVLMTVCILEEHITDGLGDTEVVIRASF